MQMEFLSYFFFSFFKLGALLECFNKRKTEKGNEKKCAGDMGYITYV